jgi:hypothetical protein
LNNNALGKVPTKINLAKCLTTSSEVLDNSAMPTKLFVGITPKGQRKHMNHYTRDIMALLKINADTAQQVQDEMCASGFDFSEATQQSFNREAKICFAVIKELAK